MVMVNCCAKMKTGKKPHPVSWTGSTGNWISTLAREASMEKSFWKGETISLSQESFFWRECSGYMIVQSIQSGWTQGKKWKKIFRSFHYHYLNKFAIESPIPIFICVNRFGDERYTRLYTRLSHTWSQRVHFPAYGFCSALDILSLISALQAFFCTFLRHARILPFSLRTWFLLSKACNQLLRIFTFIKFVFTHLRINI